MPCVIVAIKKRIEELATVSILEKLDGTYKIRFTDWFPSDIPHASDLPTNVYHHIEVKPGTAVSIKHIFLSKKI